VIRWKTASNLSAECCPHFVKTVLKQVPDHLSRGEASSYATIDLHGESGSAGPTPIYSGPRDPADAAFRELFELLESWIHARIECDDTVW
jgi:hypothetical protein